MLLIGAAHHITAKRCSVQQTGLAVAKIVRLLRGATIPAHRHPASVENRPAFILLMTDYGGEHAERDIFKRAHAYVVHHQIEENVDPGSYFGYAIQLPGGQRRGRRPDADGWARNPCVAHPVLRAPTARV